MLGNLTSRIEKLETMAGMNPTKYPKVVRIVTTDEEQEEAEGLAKEAGADDNDILVIRLIAGGPVLRE